MPLSSRESLWIRMERKELTVGVFLSLCEPRLIETVAPVGFDFIFLDNEHSLIGPSELRESIRSAAVFRVPVIVRVSEPSATEIGKTLDSGAVGVVVPHVEDADDLARAVSYTRYPPSGLRGRGPTVPWLGELQGHDPANWTPGVVAIVESLRGVAGAEDLVRVPGLSAVLPGPGDLSQELGGVGPDDPDLRAHIDTINRAVTAIPEGPALMSFCPGPDPDVTVALRSGATTVLVGPDTALLRSSCSRVLAQAREEHARLPAS